MSKRTLLLADDSVTIQKVVNLTFADEGIEVITVGDGDSAMEKISQMSPDVVLADVHMPGLSGYQICEIIRQNPVTKDMPVVLLVGSFEPFDESEAARVGANAYLTKPFQSIRQLVSQVTDLMEISNPTPEPAMAEETRFSEEAPVEKRTEREPAGAAASTDDIESLIHQSFSSSSTAVEADTGAPRYVDAGMDDEMIETSFADPTDQPQAEASPMIAADGDSGFRAFEPAPYARSNETSNYSEPERLDEAEQVPTEPTSAFDTLADSRDEIAPANAGGERHSEFDEFSRTEPSLEIGGTTANRFGLDEIELLELPPIENGKTLEFTTTQRAIADGGSKQVVSLSPELMDIIVQKVVEKLSEKF